ncbi:MAG: hypothetical protein OXI43_12675 [Candidatus Poribacteria bacterium]|nr:hypothetical protein [Candidatus Poribacteria bacterium]
MKKYRIVDEENKLIADVDINDSGFHVKWAGVGKDVNSFDGLLESLPEGKSWKIQRYQRVNESTNVRRYKQYSIAGQSLGRCEYLVYNLPQTNFGELVGLEILEAAIAQLGGAKKTSLASFVSSLRKKIKPLGNTYRHTQRPQCTSHSTTPSPTELMRNDKTENLGSGSRVSVTTEPLPS